MTAMILTPDQARAVVGAPRVDDCEPLARFIPAATADAWPIGERIDVSQGCDDLLHEHWDCPSCLATGCYPVGRVRLGEPVPVRHWHPVSAAVAEYLFINDERSFLQDWTDGNGTDIIHPHLDLFSDAWQPGSWAYPITERSTT